MLVKNPRSPLHKSVLKLLKEARKSTKQKFSGVFSKLESNNYSIPPNDHRKVYDFLNLLLESSPDISHLPSFSKLYNQCKPAEPKRTHSPKSVDK